MMWYPIIKPFLFTYILQNNDLPRHSHQLESVHQVLSSPEIRHLIIALSVNRDGLSFQLCKSRNKQYFNFTHTLEVLPQKQSH